MIKSRNKKRNNSRFVLVGIALFVVLGATAVYAATSSYTYTDTYNYTNGIIINTYADTGGGSTSGNAAVSTGETIYYTLEIVNQGTAPKAMNGLKFTIPKGYKIDVNSPGAISCSGLSPCPTPTSPSGQITSNGDTQIIWGGFTASAGTSKIVIKLGT